MTNLEVRTNLWHYNSCTLRAKCCLQHSARLPAETCEIRKCLLTFSLKKLRQTAAAILKTYEQFTYGDIGGVIQSNTYYFLRKYNHSYNEIFTWVSKAAVLLQAWSGPECSRKLRFPDFMTMAQNGGKVVSLTHRPPLPAGNSPSTHFC